MKDTDIIAAIAPDAVSLMDKAIAEIKRLRQENATLTAEHDALRAERDEARREVCDRAVADYLVDGTIKYDNSGKWRKVARERGWDFEQEALL